MKIQPAETAGSVISRFEEHNHLVWWLVSLWLVACCLVASNINESDYGYSGLGELCAFS